MTNQRKEQSVSVVGWPAFRKRDFNPYNRLLYTAVSQLGVDVRDFGSTGWRTLDCDVIHVHWPESSMRFASSYLATRQTLKRLWILASLRRRGMRVVWTAHNLEEHERWHRRLSRFFWRVFPNLVDGAISLSESNVDLLSRRLRRLEVPIAVIPHGHYRDAYPDTISRVEARRALGLERDALVFGWVGQIRAYKNVDGLVSAFGKVSERPWRLVLAGEVGERDLHERLLTRTKRDARVQYRPGWVRTEEMQRYVKASNVIVLPYHRIWNSGAALLALSFNRPVVLPRSDSMLELQQQVGEDWVYLYAGPFSREVLNDCVDWLRNRRRSPAPDMRDLAWESIAERTVAFYEQVIGACARPVASPPLRVHAV